MSGGPVGDGWATAFLSENMDNPSQHEANKLVRVLSGKPLKFTVRVHTPDGKVVEFQCPTRPKVDFYNETRSLWLVAGDYGSTGIMAWVDGSILLVEENPS